MKTWPMECRGAIGCSGCGKTLRSKFSEPSDYARGDGDRRIKCECGKVTYFNQEPMRCSCGEYAQKTGPARQHVKRSGSGQPVCNNCMDPDA